jgi:xanthine dehydrogenase accessory factor
VRSYVLIRGGGDLASGAALRLHRAGLRTLMLERPQPLAVRRTVSFAQAVYDGVTRIEEVTGRLVRATDGVRACWDSGEIPLLVDPDMRVGEALPPLALVDARMRKKPPETSLDIAGIVVGLGPGFTAGENCHVAIETNRGHFLGRVVREGSPAEDTGVPGQVGAYREERVLHAPREGRVETFVEIGSVVAAGTPILSVGGVVVKAPFGGLLRGLIHDGLLVRKGTKVGDVDPRPESFRCRFVSDKALAIGGGVLEALLHAPAIRQGLWD